MKTSGILLWLLLTVYSHISLAQNGLENIIVERYYVADAADAAGSAGIIPVGSVTYRIYVDMLPGYKFQAAYGTSIHSLTISTTTSFFNNELMGAASPSYSIVNAALNTVMLDSWLTAGAGCAGNYGILKSEDDGIATVINQNGFLQNNSWQAGIPLTLQDGLFEGNGVPEAMVLVGDQITSADSIFDAISQLGGSFMITDGEWGALNGASGPTGSNRILLGQFTTDGIFHFELNIRIMTPSAGVENYVAANPVAGEITITGLTQTFIPNPFPPTVSINAPTNNAAFSIGAPVPISADAADADGTVTQVEFILDGVPYFIDAQAPYAAPDYTGLVEASHMLTARSTDNEGFLSELDSVTFNIVNSAPTFTNFSISPPVNGVNYVQGDVVTMYATAFDPDGNIFSIQFYVDGNPQGAAQIGNTQTFSASVPYTSVAGIHLLTATAVDNHSKSFTTPVPISLTVNSNVPPSVVITAPVNGATPALNTPLTLIADATDTDGFVSSVEFFSGTTSLGMGIFTAGFYSLTYIPVIQGPVNFTAKAIDNKGGITISVPVTVTITDYNVAYTFTQTSGSCFNNGFCIPVATVSPVANINGYNFIVQYDKTKVVPTGNILVSNDLIMPFLPPGYNAEYITDYSTTIDDVAGTISIGIFFNSVGGTSAVFTGSGDVCCIEFVKTINFQTVDTAVFSFIEIIESYQSSASLYKSGSDGQYSSFKNDTLTGSLKFWCDYSPIQYDPLNPTDFLITNILGCNQAANAVQPDLAGNFAYSISNGTTIDIKRDIAPATNIHSVINGQDSYFTILVSVKGTNKINWTPSVFQMIAMDVNRDGQVTAGDATQINQRAVGAITEFSQVDALGKDWSFVANTVLANDLNYLISTTFPEDDGVGYSKYRVPIIESCQAVPVMNPSGCPVIQDEYYIGVMIGDVDGNYKYIAPDGLIKNESADTASEISINLSAAAIYNDVMSIPVSLSTSKDVHSFDLDLIINDQKVLVQSIENQYGIDINWNYIASDKKVSLASYSLNPISTENVVFLNLKLLTSEPITILDLTGDLALVNGSTANVRVIGATAGIDSSKEKIVHIYPNPVTDKFNVDVTEDSKIQLLDLTGKPVIQEQGISSNQTQSVGVSHLAPGIYLVKVYNDKFTRIEKLVIGR